MVKLSSLNGSKVLSLQNECYVTHSMGNEASKLPATCMERLVIVLRSNKVITWLVYNNSIYSCDSVCFTAGYGESKQFQGEAACFIYEINRKAMQKIPNAPWAQSIPVWILK